MTFSVNHPILFVLVGLIIAVVIAQSVYFLVKSLRRAKQKGMDMKKEKLKETGLRLPKMLKTEHLF